MIVKNESKIITRLLDSVLPIVNAISITDTGSTDGTQDKIKEYCKLKEFKNIFIYEQVFENFGIDRTKSFNNCIETAKKLKYKLKNTYCLLLDADMELIIDKTFKPKQLTEILYMIEQKNNMINYSNIRLLRLDKQFKCIGCTHEFWECLDKNDNEIVSNKILNLIIIDHEDGGCKDTKFERDIKLLTQGLLDEPDNSRYMFYLAQSYRDIGNNLLAIEYYRMNVISDSWDEEKFYSMLMIGRLSENRIDIFTWLLNAYEYRPQRAEPLYYLGKFYSDNRLYNQSYLFLNMAKNIKYPENDKLFIEYEIYKYKILFELSIVAYYTIYKKEGYEACKELLKMENIPENIIELTKSNIKFYEK